MSRSAKKDIFGVKPVKANLLDKATLEKALEHIHPTHVFFTTWMKGSSEEENILLNSSLVANLLDTVRKKRSVKHVTLVTGLKHYLGPFESYVSEGKLPETPLREDQPRLSFPNFYYAQEDELFAAAEKDGFTWNVHRPHTVIGNAVGNLMNMGTTSAVYASICKEHNLPFIFPGSKAQWEGSSDVTDAKILAKQIIWATQTPLTNNKAFNILNGDVFRWSWLWKQIAEWFRIEYEGFQNQIRPLEKTLEGKEALWTEMAQKFNLVGADLNKVSSAWHTDLDLGRPIEVITDITNSRSLGFKEFYNTKKSFISLFEKLKLDKVIP
ncbi:SDR family oxidoreductase [Flavobacterium agricola]|uniref:SDR family oxidoreductase n=1 Tax=Flavobacterium agricola TaxID=2870839 RepID=UPI0022224AAD|nr:SDR family oxidoreductase [Flavobacterium agricola]